MMRESERKWANSGGVLRFVILAHVTDNDEVF